MALKSILFKGDNALNAAAVNHAAHITLNAQGDHVAKIQQCVLIHGRELDLGNEVTTRTYGQRTADAVQSYKADRSIINTSYQKSADGIVGIMTMDRMDKDMLAHEAATGNFVDFTTAQMIKVELSLRQSREMVELVVRRLRGIAGIGPNGGALIVPRNLNWYDTKLKVFNVFRINTFEEADFPVDLEIFATEVALYRDNPFPAPGDRLSDGLQFARLLTNFEIILDGLKKPFVMQFWPSASYKGQGLTFLSEFVGLSTDPDKNVHFTRRYFNDDEVDDDSRAVTLAHERAHTLLRADGHPGTGQSPMCVAPHRGADSVQTSDVALVNAYCYEWLIYALQPNYDSFKHAGIECGAH